MTRKENRINILQQTIADLIVERSKALHTGDKLTADATRNLLMLAWAELPDNTPYLKPSINYGGIAYVLQSGKNGTYRYVKNSIYNDEAFAYVPTDRQTKILMELHINNTALSEIKDLEAKGSNPIAEDVEEEIA